MATCEILLQCGMVLRVIDQGQQFARFGEVMCGTRRITAENRGPRDCFVGISEEEGRFTAAVFEAPLPVTRRVCRITEQGKNSQSDANESASIWCSSSGDPPGFIEAMG